jgi:hypothetical protein
MGEEPNNTTGRSLVLHEHSMLSVEKQRLMDRQNLSCWFGDEWGGGGGANSIFDYRRA